MKSGQGIRPDSSKNASEMFCVNLINRIDRWMMAAVCMVSCETMSPDGEIVFLGDSIISRWDTESSFMPHHTRNIGKGGSGIRWIEQYSGTLTNQTVVLLTGTNDIVWIDDTDKLQNYADRYVKAIVQLQAKRVLLISVLPKSDDVGLEEDIDGLIRGFNRMIRTRIEGEPSITYCDVYDEFAEGSHLNANLSYDGIHPNKYGYEILTKRVKQCLP